jgi:hypothetical protein
MLQISCSETNCLVTPLHSEENSCDFVFKRKKIVECKTENYFIALKVLFNIDWESWLMAKS